MFDRLLLRTQPGTPPLRALYKSSPTSPYSPISSSYHLSSRRRACVVSESLWECTKVVKRWSQVRWFARTDASYVGVAWLLNFADAHLFATGSASGIGKSLVEHLVNNGYVGFTVFAICSS